MALNTPDQNTTQDSSNNAGQQQQPNMGGNVNGGQQQQNQNRRGAFSFADLGALSRAPMALSPTSEVLSKLTKSMEEIFKSIEKPYKVTLVPIDLQNEPDLTFSVLVVCLQDTSRNDIGVSFHILILEGSVEEAMIDSMTRVESSPQGKPIEIIRVAGDAYDRMMIDVVVKHLRRQFKHELIPADGCVVPREFDVSDEEAVYRLATVPGLACFTELEKHHPDFVDLNIANATNDTNLVVRYSFGNPQQMDQTGMPVRSDVMIDFAAVTQQKNPQNVMQSMNSSLERSRPISQISGFMDLIWNPEGIANNPYFQYGQMPVQHRYVPRFIMTGLTSFRLLTLPAQLLALVNVFSIGEDNAWIGGFRPRPFSQGEVDIHDVGAIGIEANLENNPNGIGNRIDTKSDGFRPENLGRLLTLTVKPNLVVSLDVPECGPQTWLNSLFAIAAEAGGNPEQAAKAAKANATIVNAANFLTNGAFGRIFPANGRVVVPNIDRVHLGYYVDKHGAKKDLRDIDYLAFLNLIGEQDLDVVRDYSDTILRTQYPLAQRLSARKTLITNLVPGAQVKVKGFARRVTFEELFLRSLAQACIESGLSIRPQAPYQDMGYERATGSVFAGAMLNPQQTGVFNRNFMGGNQQSMGAVHGWSARW